MNPAPRALSSLGLVFFLLAAGAAAQPGTAEMTVEFESPARAVVRTRIPTSHPLAQSASFHALAPSPDTGWQRRPASFERAAAELVFGDSAGAGEAGRFQIGVPLPDTAPEAGADSAFSVRITPPPGYRIADDFPALTPGGPAGGTLEAHLPAPPALLSC